MPALRTLVLSTSCMKPHGTGTDSIIRAALAPRVPPVPAPGGHQTGGPGGEEPSAVAATAGAAVEGSGAAAGAAVTAGGVSALVCLRADHCQWLSGAVVSEGVGCLIPWKADGHRGQAQAEAQAEGGVHDSPRVGGLGVHDSPRVSPRGPLKPAPSPPFSFPFLPAPLQLRALGPSFLPYLPPPLLHLRELDLSYSGSVNRGSLTLNLDKFQVGRGGKVPGRQEGSR